MIRPLGNCIIARKITIAKKGGLYMVDKSEERLAQLVEIVALPEYEPNADSLDYVILYNLVTAVSSAAKTGSETVRVYVRFRGYSLDDAEEDDLCAIAIEDVLAIDDRKGVSA